MVTRYLTLPAEDAAPRVQLLERLMSGKVGDPALDVLRARRYRSAGRPTPIWRMPSSTLRGWHCWTRAEREGQEDEVEEQLFRFCRILDAQPRLGTLLGDYTVPVEGRVRLLRKVLEGASGTVDPITVALLSQTVELLRGEPAEEAALFLAEVAVARRGEVVAQVSAAAELSDAQRTRVTECVEPHLRSSGCGADEHRCRGCWVGCSIAVATR